MSAGGYAFSILIRSGNGKPLHTPPNVKYTLPDNVHFIGRQTFIYITSCFYNAYFKQYPWKSKSTRHDHVQFSGHAAAGKLKPYTAFFHPRIAGTRAFHA
jgi:hypothetical protein